MPCDPSLSEGLYNGVSQVRACDQVSLRSQLDREGVGKRACMWKEIRGKNSFRDLLLHMLLRPSIGVGSLSYARASLDAAFKPRDSAEPCFVPVQYVKRFHSLTKHIPANECMYAVVLIPLPTKLIGIIQPTHTRAYTRDANNKNTRAYTYVCRSAMRGVHYLLLLRVTFQPQDIPVFSSPLGKPITVCPPYPLRRTTRQKNLSCHSTGMPWFQSSMGTAHGTSSSTRR